MQGGQIRQGESFYDTSIYSSDSLQGREKLKYALQAGRLSAWGIEQGSEERSEIPAGYWTDGSKIDYFNSVLDCSVYCNGYSEIYMQTDQLIDCFPVPESERLKKPSEFPGGILAGCHPEIYYFDFSVPSGECLVVEAIERIGEELFPNEWTGRERKIYQEGYCWQGGLFGYFLAPDKSDMLLKANDVAIKSGIIKHYWPLFKDNSKQKYFSNLYGLLESRHPRLVKDGPLPQYAEKFIADLKDNWPEIKVKAKTLEENFIQVKKRWKAAFKELIKRVGDNARCFDFNGMNNPAPIIKDKWFTDMSDLYHGGLEIGLIYPECYKTLGLPENGKWGVLVPEDVLYKAEKSGDNKKKDNIYWAIERFHNRARKLRKENPSWTQEQIWDEMEKDDPPHKGTREWSRKVYARICTGEYPAAKDRGFGPIFQS
ncbi:MAG: hypothetical protein COA81_00855 [Alphaproteobacteria bacterium]|nr:MAG: hypothetical protein COA81_00855 [Alphaproteobacteria bacterium]